MTSSKRLAVLVLTLATSITLAAQSAQELYQRALVREHGQGNLTQAIELYGQVVQQAGTDRALAARALRRLAAAQEKLGHTADAAGHYAELIRTYPEQRAEVTAAQARLSLLHHASGGEALTATTEGVPSMRPVLETYCLACHNSRQRSGGLDLDAPSRARIAENTELWEAVTQRLHARRDPPVGAPRPPDASYARTIATLEHALDAAYLAERTAPSERVSDVELAARVATLLWNGKPDAELLAAAQRGDLRQPQALQRQVRRMMRDARSRALVDSFFAEWLSLDRIRNASAFPHVNRDLLQAMDTETRLFVHSQLQSDADATNLWTASYSYVNERLAHHYGLTGISGTEFRRVTWPDHARGGLLGQGGPLTTLASATRTSPTRRGLYILTRYLGIDAPDPPANVPPLEERPANPSGTMRERITAHRSNPACAQCHSMFDPLGFGLENFDASGAWRLTDSGAPIDASGTFLDGTHFNGPSGLRAGLLKYRTAYYTAVTQRLMAFALHRVDTGGHVYDYEMSAVRKVVRDASAHQYSWSSIIAGITASAPFQKKHVVP